MKRWIPWVLVIVMAGWVAGQLAPKSESGFHTGDFGRLPILMNGRFQPMESLARNSLLQIRTKQTVYDATGARPETLSAVEWLMELTMKPDRADERPVFRIDNPEVLSVLKLSESQKYYSYNQIKAQADELDKQAERADRVEAAARSSYESQIIKLYGAVTLYQRLQVSLKPPGVEDFTANLEEFQRSLAPGIAAVRARDEKKPFDQAAFDALVGLMTGYDSMARFGLPLAVPPSEPGARREAWQTIGSSLMETAKTGQVAPVVKDYAAMVTAYQAGDAAGFNKAVDDCRQWLAERYGPEVRKAAQESFFSRLQPFYNATVIYVLAFVLACVSLLGVSEWVRKSAVGLVVLALVLHTIGLVFRMYLEGRPPVTNLYSSAVFIGWACVVLGLVLERIYPISIGVLAASLVGFITQIIAHHLALTGDTMEMMRAVLDTNFWLATHVVTVTLGYASTFLAGALAILYVVLGLFTHRLTQPLAGDARGLRMGAVLTKMVYGIICFATLFSFVGTVLGGIWADQSWGRFWGWDPKENGALLIVIWNAIILHARWGGLVRERGLMNLAIFGNIITSFSWFGVNMLGIGLHSYGFMDAAFKWLMLFMASQAVLILLGCLPVRFWKSFRPAPAAG